MKKIILRVGISVVLIAVLYCVLCIPYARTVGVVTREFHSAGTVLIDINGSNTEPRTEISKDMIVEFIAWGRPYEVKYHQVYYEDSPFYGSKFNGDTVEVYYNPIIPSINKLA